MRTVNAERGQRTARSSQTKWQNLLDQVFAEGESQMCKLIYLKALLGELVVLGFFSFFISLPLNDLTFLFEIMFLFALH